MERIFTFSAINERSEINFDQNDEQSIDNEVSSMGKIGICYGSS